MAPRFPEPAGARAGKTRRGGTSVRAGHPVRRCLLALAGLSAVSAAATVAAPALWDRPVLLLALTPRMPFLVHAGREASWWLVGPVAVARLCLGDPFHYLLGRHGITASAPRLRAWVRRRMLRSRVRALAPGGLAHVVVTRVAAVATRSVPLLVMVRPIGRHLVLAGTLRTSAGVVAAADVAGTVAYVALVLAGGAVTG